MNQSFFELLEDNDQIIQDRTRIQLYIDSHLLSSQLAYVCYDQDDYKLNLIAIDIIWSYFQDCFSTTHYVGITGENDSGKSSIGNTFEAIGYRVVNMTSPSAANVFRVLGMIEAGQCTLVLDESDRISDDPDIMEILRSGYDFNKKVPKTNNTNWKQEWYFTYCPKIIIGEKSPSKFKAKGLLDRTFLFSTIPGDTELDIKEVQNPKGDPVLERALAELLDFRRLMLVYRLIHFNDSIPDLDVGVTRRNKELCKPYIRLFYGSESQREIEQTFQEFLNAKSDRKSTSIEAILIPIIIDLVEQKGCFDQILTSEVWDFIKQNLEGQSDPYDPDKYYISDYTLYKSTITKLLEDKFGADYKHTRKGGRLLFNLDKLQKVQKSYNNEIIIRTSLRSKRDTCDTRDGSREYASLPDSGYSDSMDIDSDNNNHDFVKDAVNISKNDGLVDAPEPLASLQAPSHPSHPSPSAGVSNRSRSSIFRLGNSDICMSELQTKRRRLVYEPTSLSLVSKIFGLIITKA